MPVDRCVCHDVTFKTLKAHADARSCGFDELQERFSCGRSCGLCRPYIQAMLRTGRTVFEPDDPDIISQQ